VRKLLLPSALLVLALACSVPGVAVPSSSSAPQPLSIESLGTTIALTAAAAQTQTAAFQPPTLTPTLAGEPTSTFIAQPATQTPFSLFTAVVPVETIDPAFEATAGIPGLGGSSEGDPVAYTGRPWTCVVKSVSPPRGGTVQAGKEFYVTWTVLNTGTKNWTTTTIDFIYKSGYRHEGKPIQDLWKNVPSGRTINLQVLFKAPKVPSEYAANWTLRVGNYSFCEMRATFEVVKK
jgi:hypothetical protein